MMGIIIFRGRDAFAYIFIIFGIIISADLCCCNTDEIGA
jgi:hypothetical protein